MPFSSERRRVLVPQKAKSCLLHSLPFYLATSGSCPTKGKTFASPLSVLSSLPFKERSYKCGGEEGKVLQLPGKLGPDTGTQHPSQICRHDSQEPCVSKYIRSP